MSLPELKWILGKTYNETTFKLTNNTFMQGIYVPVLGSVRGDVVIANNAVLDTLSFPNLAMVEGNMLLSGGFDRLVFPLSPLFPSSCFDAKMLIPICCKESLLIQTSP